MTTSQLIRRAAAALAAAAVLTPTAVLAAGAIKAAYVETVIPAKTYFNTLFARNTLSWMGPGSGVMGVTSITLTNHSDAAQLVGVITPIIIGPNSTNRCNGTLSDFGPPEFQVYVQARSTLHLTYPTPLVFPPATNPNIPACIGFSVSTPLPSNSSVEVSVNSVIN